MSEILTIRRSMSVQLVQSMGDDEMICKAARVSNLGVDSLHTSEAAGLIRYLMEHKHGSPFEHGALTFLIEAPIFVFREFHRHRVGWSYNEVSGRYRELAPVFYVPMVNRPLINVASSARPEFQFGQPGQLMRTIESMTRAYEASWAEYQAMLADGIAKEVARSVLPVGIYSAMYATCNPRSLMHFLGLRTQKPHATFPSYPQLEIQAVADQMEDIFSSRFPLTWEAFNKTRVAP